MLEDEGLEAEAEAAEAATEDAAEAQADDGDDGRRPDEGPERSDK